MSHPHAQVNPEMLRWARGRMGMDIHNAAVAAGVKPEQLERWEAGDGLPTFRQAQNVAQALHAPFGFFFLQQAPAEEPLLPDLRTVGGRTVESPSVDLLETIKQALQRQAWYLEYQQEQGGAPLPFVGKFTTDAAPHVVAADMLAVLVKSNQVLLFTHHRRVRALAEPLVEKGLANIIDLDRPSRTPA